MNCLKFSEISHFLNLHDSSLGRYVNAASRKSLEIYQKKLRTTLQSQVIFWNSFIKHFTNVGAQGPVCWRLGWH